MDYPFLLAAQPPQIPNPLDLMGKGLTLGEMANKLQMGQLGLQTAQQQAALWQDPSMGPVLQQLLGGSGGGGIDTSKLQSNYGLALPGFVNQALGMAEKQATTSKDNAMAMELTQKAQEASLQKVSNMAADVLANPTPQGILSLQRQQEYLAKLGRPPESYGGAIADSTSPEDMFAKLQTFGAMSSDAKTQAEIKKIPVDIWSTKAKIALDYAQAGKGEIRPTVGGTPYLAPPPYPNGPPQMPPPPGAAPPAAPANYVQKTTADGIPVMAPPEQNFSPAGAGRAGTTPAAAYRQEKLSPIEEENMKAAAAEVGNLNTKAMSASQMQALVLDMRNKEAQGILSGGIQGSEFFRNIANISAAMGAKGEIIDKLQNTQAWSADSGHLIAQAVSQFAGARIAARELTFFENIKPQLIQTPEGREQIYQALYNISDRIKQQASQAQDYVNQPQNMGKGLGGFTPAFTTAKIPDMQVPGLPDPAQKRGWTATGPDGVKYQSDGVKWNRI